MAAPHRYLITGAQGFVGRYLVHCLLSRSDNCTILGIGRSPQRDSHFLHPLSCAGHEVLAPLPAALRASPCPRYSYLSIDLLSYKLADVVSQFQPTAVVHLAASLRGVTDEFILWNNVHGTESLLKALRIRANKLEMLLLASSGGVYGCQDTQPIREDALLKPIDDYAKSKGASEELVQDFAERSDAPVAIARIFNVLGPGQDELHLAGRLVSQIGAIVGNHAPAVIRTRSLGSTRDFLDVRDVSTALALILEQNRGGIYNIGSGVETQLADLLMLFLKSAELQQLARIESGPNEIDPIPRHVANIQKLAATGFLPSHPLARCCCDMLEYYQRLILPTATSS